MRPGVSFTPWKACFGLGTVFGGLAILAGVLFFIPDEPIGRTVLADGRLRFVVQSMHHAVVSTIGITALLVVGAGLYWLLADKLTVEHQRRYPRGEPTRAGRAIGYGILGVIFAAGLGIIGLGQWSAIQRIRVITIGKNRVQLTSLYCEWDVAKSEVVDVQKDVVPARANTVEYHLTITMAGGRVFRTAEADQLVPGSADERQFDLLVTEVVDALGAKRGPQVDR